MEMSKVSNVMTTTITPLVSYCYFKTGCEVRSSSSLLLGRVVSNDLLWTRTKTLNYYDTTFSEGHNIINIP